MKVNFIHFVYFLDGSSNKQFPRARRRETPSNGGTKFEQGRKPTPQKSKTLDKRPRPRGQYYHGGKEDTQVNIKTVLSFI